MAKVFVSTLGTGDYVPCHYIINGWRSNLVVFVQEALFDYLCPTWGEKDRVIVFCTEEAEKKNWCDHDNFEGLQTRLKSRNYPPEICMISVPSGKSENEIMAIFLKVMENLKPGDEVFMDITHSFRSIPLLLTVAINYGKVVKGISVGGIFYGALEALGTIPEVKKMPEDERDVPVFDLTAYDSIIEWARAVEVFKKAGYVDDLGALINKNLGSLFKDESKKIDKNLLKMFSTLKSRLESLVQSLATARGAEIYSYDFTSFSDIINKIEDSDLIPPMKPLFEILKESLAGFEESDPMKRTFNAAEWCLDHMMIPQAYIFLREAVITGLCDCSGLDYLDEKNREGFWSSLLHALSKNELDEIKERGALAVQVVNRGGEPLRKLVKTFEKLRAYRNDYLHGGWRDKPIKSQRLIRNIREYLSELRGNWAEYQGYREGCKKKAFVVLSHELTDEQKKELFSIWSVREIVIMPSEVREAWEKISPSVDSLEKELKPVIDWLETCSSPGDVVVVQGEYGATVRVAMRSREIGLIPIYATTERVLEENKLPDGSIKVERIFRHVKFRKYFD